MNIVRNNIRPTPTYEVAQMILGASEAGDQNNTKRFSVTNMKNTNPDYDQETFISAIEIFTTKKFIRPATDSETSDVYIISKPEMLRQYANRTECEF